MFDAWLTHFSRLITVKNVRGINLKTKTYINIYMPVEKYTWINSGAKVGKNFGGVFEKM